MSIDQAGAAVSPKASAAPDSRVAKGKSNDAADAPEGGFSFLLSAVTPMAEPSGENLVAVTDQAAPSIKDEKKAITDVSLLISPPPTSLMNVPILPDVNVDKTALVGDGLAAEFQELSTLNLMADGVDVVDPHSALQGEVDPKATIEDEVLKLGDLALHEGKLIQPDSATAHDTKTVKLSQARQSMGEELRADATHARLESRALKATTELELHGKDAMQAKLSLVGDFAARFLEPAERPRGKPFGPVGVSGAEGGWTQYAHHARTTTDLPSSLNAMVTTSTQTQVADKVSYWVTQGIQNAELKLEGFGADPVEVSILLKGGEAHVGFRTDQPEVRQMLEGALSQLKDSLEREGVVLSGVTVGGSGADGGERQQEQRRESSANRRGGVSQALQENRTLRAPTSVGRSLDIFV